MTPFQRFAPLLRAEGFRKRRSSRMDGVREDEWSRAYGHYGREVWVRISSDGRHRAGHKIWQRETTRPTEFTDEESFEVALVRECNRRDNLNWGSERPSWLST